MAMSRLVQVGDLNMTVSDRMAEAIKPAMWGEGVTPCSWYMEVMMVLVLPTGSLRTEMGWRVWMSARRWWSMMLQDLRLLDARDGLGQLVVVHQYHLLAPGRQQVIAGQGAHHLLLRVQHGVAAVAALQHHLADIVDIIVHMEGDRGRPWRRGG